MVVLLPHSESNTVAAVVVAADLVHSVVDMVLGCFHNSLSCGLVQSCHSDLNRS